MCRTYAAGCVNTRAVPLGASLSVARLVGVVRRDGAGAVHSVHWRPHQVSAPLISTDRGHVEGTEMTFVRGVGGHPQDRSQAAVNLPHQTSTREVRIANFSRWGPPGRRAWRPNSRTPTLQFLEAKPVRQLPQVAGLANPATRRSTTHTGGTRPPTLLHDYAAHWVCRRNRQGRGTTRTGPPQCPREPCPCTGSPSSPGYSGAAWLGRRDAGQCGGAGWLCSSWRRHKIIPQADGSSAAHIAARIGKWELPPAGGAAAPG